MKGFIGHESVRASLHQMLVKNQVPHAQLFLGPEGVGKLKVAKALAQTLLCQQSHVDFCGMCPSCLQVQKGQHQGLHVLDTENAQIKMEESRDILKKLTLRSWNGPRIIIINDAHKMNLQASNALLKVIEEPPEGTYFLLVSSQPKKILPTIRSRTQVIRFGPLAEEQLQKISGATGWMLASANGSVTRLQRLQAEDSEETRSLALKSLVQMLSSEVSYLQWMELLQAVTKDRAQVEVLLETWLQLIRDLRVDGWKPAYHSDLLVEMRQIPLGDLQRLDAIFEIISYMKSQLDFNVDRQLLLESGFLKVQESLNLRNERRVL